MVWLEPQHGRVSSGTQMDDRVEAGRGARLGAWQEGLDADGRLLVNASREARWSCKYVRVSSAPVWRVGTSV